jgi:predicted adenylyl cyclase CyaB
MQNIEIKARKNDHAATRKTAEKIGARYEGQYSQKDTYYRVDDGRLKLRETDATENQLIYYSRPDQRGPKISDYQIFAVEDIAALKDILGVAMGEWLIVEKRRLVYWYDDVRIHIDQVTDLGNFLELEGVITDPDNSAAVRSKVDHLLKVFMIGKDDLVASSYSDLLARQT